jgi:hypothetical protein
MKFSTRDMMLSVASFAVASGIMLFCITRPPSLDIGDITGFCVALGSPFIGGFIGLGIGCLIQRKLQTMILGTLIPLPFLILIIAIFNA